MLDETQMRCAVERALAAARLPSKVIVFGSCGRGDADEGSDLDLLVGERGEVSRHGAYMRIRSAIGRVAPGAGVDLPVCSNEDDDRRSAVPFLNLQATSRFAVEFRHDDPGDFPMSCEAVAEVAQSGLNGCATLLLARGA